MRLIRQREEKGSESKRRTLRHNCRRSATKAGSQALHWYSTKSHSCKLTSDSPRVRSQCSRLPDCTFSRNSLPTCHHIINNSPFIRFNHPQTPLYTSLERATRVTLAPALSKNRIRSRGRSSSMSALEVLVAGSGACTARTTSRPSSSPDEQRGEGVDGGDVLLSIATITRMPLSCQPIVVLASCMLEFVFDVRCG